jgi:hypothetical protein
MSVVPPENKAPFKHDVITRFLLVRGVKSFIVAVSCIVEETGVPGKITESD